MTWMILRMIMAHMEIATLWQTCILQYCHNYTKLKTPWIYKFNLATLI